MLYKPIPITAKDIIVGMKVRVVYHQDGIEHHREGRITKITGDYLYKYLWVNDRVIGVVAREGSDAETLLNEEVFLLEDFMDEETHALSRALLDCGHNLTGNAIRDVLRHLHTYGFRIAKCRKHNSIIPKPPIETTCKRPAQ